MFVTGCGRLSALIGQVAGRRALWFWAAALAIVAYWLYATQTHFFVGPSEWDDVYYWENARGQGPRWELRNRYFYIWLMRLYYLAWPENPLRAAGLFTTTVSAVTAISAAIIAFHLAGRKAALAALVLVPSHHALLKWVSVPYVDHGIAMWATLCIACLLSARRLAVTDARCGTRTVALFALHALAGATVYFAIKTKETGLALVPVAIAFLVLIDRRPRAWLSTLAGFLAGWCAHRGLDALLVSGDWTWWSSDPWVYFGNNPNPAPHGHQDVRMSASYVDQLTRPAHLAATLACTAGIVSLYREHQAVRLMTWWIACMLAFGSFIATRWLGIFADERYLAGIAPVMVVIAVFWAIDRFRRAQPDRWTRHLLEIAIVVLICAFPLYGSIGREMQLDGPQVRRALFYWLPLGTLFLFVAGYLLRSRSGRAASLIALALLAAWNSHHEARKYVASSRMRMAPWRELAGMVDEQWIDLARHGRTYPAWRIRRRIATYAVRDDVRVRNLKRIEDAEGYEWVIVRGSSSRTMERRNWRRMVHGVDKDGPWSAYRPPWAHESR